MKFNRFRVEGSEQGLLGRITIIIIIGFSVNYIIRFIPMSLISAFSVNTILEHRAMTLRPCDGKLSIKRLESYERNDPVSEATEDTPFSSLV
jgi:hypothetical protein